MFKVIAYVSAQKLGTEKPWVIDKDDAEVEGDDYRISDRGDLTILNGYVKVATFESGHWFSIRRVEDDA